eukprot:jgi/Bigna1/147065/aug1.128_g21773
MTSHHQLVDEFGEEAAADLEYFDSLLNTVPANYYYPKQHDSASAAIGKLSAKQRKSSGITDPHRMLSVLDVAKFVWSKASGSKRSNFNTADTTKKAKGAKKSRSEAKSIDALRQLLKDKMESLRSGRGSKNENGGGKIKQKVASKKKTKADDTGAKKRKHQRESKMNPTKRLKSEDQATEEVGDGDLMFSGLKNNSEKNSRSMKKNKKKAKKSSEELQLQRIQEFEKKLKNVSTKEREEILHERRISHAISRAQGIAVKDDKKLLRKQISRKNAKKAKSKKAWESRMQQLQTEQKTELDKRDQNVKEYNAKKSEARIAKRKAKRK